MYFVPRCSVIENPSSTGRNIIPVRHIADDSRSLLWEGGGSSAQVLDAKAGSQHKFADLVYERFYNNS